MPSIESTKPKGPQRNPAEVLILIVMVAAVAVIAAVEGVLNPFWIWNVFPVVLSLGLLLRFIRHFESSGVPIVVAAGAFALVTVGLVLAFHIAWALDLGGTATGSSTSGLAFIFVPVWALLGGVAAFLVVYIISSCIRALFVRHP